MVEKYYGYVCDDVDTRAHFPSLPSDGDPLLYAQVEIPQAHRFDAIGDHNGNEGIICQKQKFGRVVLGLSMAEIPGELYQDEIDKSETSEYGE